MQPIVKTQCWCSRADFREIKLSVYLVVLELTSDINKANALTVIHGISVMSFSPNESIAVMLLWLEQSLIAD